MDTLELGPCGRKLELECFDVETKFIELLGCRQPLLHKAFGTAIAQLGDLELGQVAIQDGLRGEDAFPSLGGQGLGGPPILDSRSYHKHSQIQLSAKDTL